MFAGFRPALVVSRRRKHPMSSRSEEIPKVARPRIIKQVRRVNMLPLYAMAHHKTQPSLVRPSCSFR